MKGNPKSTKKELARSRLNAAVKYGKIKKPSVCSECGCADKRIVAHHHDYDLPLDVIWLCDDCHRELHKSLGRPQKEKTLNTEEQKIVTDPKRTSSLSDDKWKMLKTIGDSITRMNEIEFMAFMTGYAIGKMESKKEGK